MSPKLITTSNRSSLFYQLFVDLKKMLILPITFLLEQKKN